MLLRRGTHARAQNRSERLPRRLFVAASLGRSGAGFRLRPRSVGADDFPDGTFDIDGCDALTDLGGLGHLEKLHRLVLRDDGNLTSLAGLSMPTAGVDVTISGCGKLADLDNLGGATSLEALRLSQLPALVDVSGARSVEEIGDLDVDTTGLPSLDALGGIKIASSLSLFENPALTEIDAVGPSAQFDALSVGRNPQLERLPAFPRVTGMAQLRVEANPLLITGPSFPNLAQVTVPENQDGLVVIRANPRLPRIDGLSALVQADSIIIRDNALLGEVDLPALSNAETLIITCNPELPDAGLAPLQHVSQNPLLVGNLGSSDQCFPPAEIVQGSEAFDGG
jgi:hypothetical protein